MFGLEKYKYIFGRPKKGIHRFRIFNIAIFDVVFTFLLAQFIKTVFYPKINYFVILICAFFTGIFFHIIFDVETTVQRFLFGRN